MTEAPAPFLVTVSGQDGPGISERLFAALAERGIAVDDVEQVRVHGRLLLCVEADMVGRKWSRCAPCWRSASPGPACRGGRPIVEAAMDGGRRRPSGHAPGAGDRRGNARDGDGVDRAVWRQHRTHCPAGRVPVHSYEFTVADADVDALRRALAEAAARCQVDVAVQAAGLHRRAKHLIVLDADSTLLQGEMIDLLADRCGCGPEVAAVTEAAMAGEVDFAEALRQRVRLLAGLKEGDLEAVRDGIVLTPACGPWCGPSSGSVTSWRW